VERFIPRPGGLFVGVEPTVLTEARSELVMGPLRDLEEQIRDGVFSVPLTP